MRPFTLGCVGYCQSYSTIPSLDEVYHLLSASNPSGPAVLFIPIQVGGGGDLGLRKYFQDLCCRLHIGGLLVDVSLFIFT